MFRRTAPGEATLKLADARVLVTGATGGLGQAIARALHERGARLLLTGRRVGEIESLARACDAEVHACDLSDRAQVRTLAETSRGVDVLVANAGIPAGGDVLEMGVDDLDRALEVNLRAPIVLARLLSAGMAERRAGHIVFMSSLSGKAASPGGALYSATKFGLRGFALGLRADLHPHGVGVSTVFPGFIREAGMFALSGGRLPPGIGTRSPDDVARATIDAIERDRAEVSVAPVLLRVGASLAGLAPEASARVQRLFGAAEASRSITEGQQRAFREREAGR